MANSRHPLLLPELFFTIYPFCDVPTVLLLESICKTSQYYCHLQQHFTVENYWKQIIASQLMPKQDDNDYFDFFPNAIETKYTKLFLLPPFLPSFENGSKFIAKKLLQYKKWSNKVAEYKILHFYDFATLACLPDTRDVAKFHFEENKYVFPMLECNLRFNFVLYLLLLFEIDKNLELSKHEVIKSIAIPRYLLFLLLKQKNPQATLLPTLDIETVWLSHSIRNQEYVTYCFDRFDCIIDHSLSNMLTLEEYSEKKKQTEESWQQTFPDIPFDYSAFKTKVEEQGQVFSRKVQDAIHSDIELNISAKDVLEDRKWLPNVLSQILHSEVSLSEKVPKSSFASIYDFVMEYLFQISIHNDGSKEIPFAGELLSNYHQFLLNNYVFKKCVVQPTHLVDLMWHTHMINVRQYCFDCKQMRRRAKKSSNSNLDPNVQLSKKDYTKIYFHKPWPAKSGPSKHKIDESNAFWKPKQQVVKCTMQ